ncbi:MAG: PRC-barrel domain-containing protein, partial [Pseudomonadota bacterium]
TNTLMTSVAALALTSATAMAAETKGTNSSAPAAQSSQSDGTMNTSQMGTEANPTAPADPIKPAGTQATSTETDTEKKPEQASSENDGTSDSKPVTAQRPNGAVVQQAQPDTRLSPPTQREDGGAFYTEKIGSLVGEYVYGENGETLGDVNDVVLTNGVPNVVIGVGGFLGLGEREVAVPVERFSKRDDKLYVTNMTEEQLKNMPKHSAEGSQSVDRQASLSETMQK